MTPGPRRAGRGRSLLHRRRAPFLFLAMAGVVLVAGAGVITANSLRPIDDPAPAPAPARPSPTVTDAPGAALSLPRDAWWGGPSYYAKFPKATAAGWTKDTFFPIAVFYGKPSQAEQLASIGVNTFMGAEHDGSPISVITRTGISVIAQPEWSSKEVGDDPLVVGWHASDECDMGYSGCNDRGDNEQSRLAVQRSYVDALRAKKDGRFVQANFGNGVLGTYWAPTTMDDQVGLVDVSSVDKYAYTSPAVQELLLSAPAWPRGLPPASARAYGWLQDRMVRFSDPRASKPNWVFVETSEPNLTEPDATTISVDQIGGAVWNAIIHGAAGIAYFQHSSNGCGTYSLVECGRGLSEGVQRIDAQVAALAPVINTASYRWDFGAGLDTALKTYEGSAYIFAMASGNPGERRFTLPSGVGGTEVEVVGEGRKLPVVNGAFTDSFDAEYSRHIYRIALER